MELKVSCFSVLQITWVEMESAALLKSEIGDGSRRLLFREAVAAISLSFFSCLLSSTLLSLCLSCYKKKTRYKQEEGLCLFRMVVYPLSETCGSVLCANGTKQERKKKEVLGLFWLVWMGQPALSCDGSSPLILSSVHLAAFWSNDGDI